MCVLTCVCFSVLSDLVLIPVHTQPTDSQKELDELYDVVEVVREKWETDVSATPCVNILSCGSAPFDFIASFHTVPLSLWGFICC